MKHIILILIAVLAMFTFWRTAGGNLTAHERAQAAAGIALPESSAASSGTLDSQH
ncbi:MAG: hypothetical protein LBG72_09840 [Spirochaetaceae bacterium]|jgi:hypothetical protein|nr:hypothetical protein [Spirochaetaceae bacterium]